MNFLLPITGSFAQPAAENSTVTMIEASFRHHALDRRHLGREVVPADLGVDADARLMRQALPEIGP